METPALIFDEVDVGIAAQQRQLSANCYVNLANQLSDVCYPPATSRGIWSSTLFCSKETDGAMTETHMQSLDKKAGYKSWRACLVAVKSHVTHWQCERTACGVNFFPASRSE